jgi:LmbE family N-acetylglucosaminyl deacetylase
MSDAAALDRSGRSGRDPLMVISPHLDDAVLSCGQVLAAHRGSTVVTAFAGRPADGRFSVWDESTFLPGQDPMTIRQEEDRQALRVLGASPIHLAFLDEGYGDSPAVEEIAQSLAEQVDLKSPSTVLVPLGLMHADHERVGAASRLLITDRPHIRWIVYGDLPYRLEHPESSTERRREVETQGLRLTTVRLPTNGRRFLKLQAIRQYGSQIKPLGWKRVIRCLAPERYWAVTQSS